MLGLAGEAVTVIRPNVERDELGDVTASSVSSEAVDNVLISPGTSTDLGESRPQGSRVAYTLHFPKTYRRKLKGCEVDVRGEKCRVIGDPRPYMSINTSGEWWMQVEVERVDG